MKKFFLLFFTVLSFSIYEAKSQSSVTEITWTAADYIQYKGLLVLYPNNQGIFRVTYYLPTINSWVWVDQKAILSNTFDAYGNCTSYIHCSNPRSIPNVPYAADAFVIFPNGNMYTQDSSGKWSTLIRGIMLQPQYWQAKFREYGFN